MDSEARRLELRKFYSEQRDKHMQQIMAINGQGTLAALAVVGAMLIGGLGIDKGKIPSGISWLLGSCFALIIIGIGFLFAAAKLFSSFHSERVEKFEKLTEAAKEFDELKEEDKPDFKIRPPDKAYYLVFYGLALIVVGVFVLVAGVVIAGPVAAPTSPCHAKPG